MEGKGRGMAPPRIWWLHPLSNRQVRLPRGSYLQEKQVDMTFLSLKLTAKATEHILKMDGWNTILSFLGFGLCSGGKMLVLGSVAGWHSWFLVEFG